MRTSILALALASVAPVAVQAQSPNVLTDYAAAYRQAAAQQRPLAVVFGQGADGMQQLVGGGTITDNVRRELNSNYVTCYVDTTLPMGRAVAERFQINGQTGLVISDRTGKLQAFWHQGTLPADRLAQYLNKYADPQRVATTTEINPGPGQTSYYPPTGPLMQGGFAPAYYGQVMGGAPGYYGGGGCATCGGCSGGSCGRRR
jgi:hypothetical protein